MKGSKIIHEFNCVWNAAMTEISQCLSPKRKHCSRIIGVLISFLSPHECSQIFIENLTLRKHNVFHSPHHETTMNSILKLLDKRISGEIGNSKTVTESCEKETK